MGDHSSLERKKLLLWGFFYEDYARVSLPHTDALVITLTIENHNIHQILVDNGSSADILYWSAFEYMDRGREKITPARFPLLGFIGEQGQPVGSIELLVTTCILSRQRTLMVKFILVDRPLAYNAIIERATLNELKAVTSTPHLKMKFPIVTSRPKFKGQNGKLKSINHEILLLNP